VSNRQYRRYKPDHWAGRFRGEDLDADSQPVVRVSAGDAAGFADWLTERERSAGHRPSPCRYRLPTADEWTTIAECGDKRAFPWGNRWPPAYGNYADSTLGGLAWGWSYAADYRDGHAVSASVIECGENPWRLYGTAGNVWEWTLETRDAKQAARGGAWDSYDEEALTCAARLMLAPDSREPMVGFRLVCDAPPPAP
jgi:formylglycine-generating enzyme required for sulfatase activity